MELFLLLGAGALGIWAVFSEPARDLHSEWTEDQAREVAAMKRYQRDQSVATIDRRLEVLTGQVNNPGLLLPDFAVLEGEIAFLELERKQLLAEELIPR